MLQFSAACSGARFRFLSILSPLMRPPKLMRMRPSSCWCTSVRQASAKLVTWQLVASLKFVL